MLSLCSSQAELRKLSPLTTCRAAHHLTVAEANRHHPVHLRAIVSFYEVEKEKEDPTLFVLDETGAVYVSLSVMPAVPLVPGDLIDLTGVSSGGQFAPIVAKGSVVKVLGHPGIPDSAPRVGIGEMLSGEKDGQWVEIEAVVHSVRFEGGEVVLSLSMQGGTIIAGAPVEHGVDYSKLVDAKILLRGNAAPLFNHQEQVTGGDLNFPGIASLRIVQPANPQPFTLPVSPIINLLRYTPDPGIRHRVHVRGRATLFWAGRMLCLRDNSDGVCATGVQTTAVSPGDWVDVVGFPNLGEFSPNLVDASYRSEGPNQPIQPTHVSPSQALKDEMDEELVSIDAKLIGEDAEAKDPTAILTAEGMIFSVSLPKEKAGSVVFPQHGSTIRVTGICSLVSGGTPDPARQGFPVAESFRLLLRSQADIVVLQRPSWWNAVHALWVLAVALMVTLFALWRVALLSRRVQQQTSVIRTQLLEAAALKDAAESATVAAEFHASHDELTGILNRRTIFAALQKEFDAAAGHGSTIGVIMLDLDHFKRVNDTYGHLAGDEVLRETVRRLSHAVRSSDLIGRYGGEEFMVVLPHCDRTQLEMCAERMRAAVSASPMIVGEEQIPMTASVGAATIVPPRIAMLDALAAADSALYQAKNAGRDRVVFRDICSDALHEAPRGEPATAA